MMKALFREEGASLRIELMEDPAVTGFIDEHAAILDSGFENVEMSDKMRSRLKESDWIFSGMKTFHELNEAFPSLLDDNGQRKPFERFLNDVQSIDETYNRHYLRAEYNFAQGSAEMAGRWESFMEDGDEYYLQYRTAGDDLVRPEHAALDGVTLPPSDSFWDSYYPPNGWNCRCTVVQVLRSTNEPTDRAEALRRGKEALSKDKKGMFRFNPGKQQKTFPDYNPYTLSKCTTCTRKLNLAKGIADNELCEACRFLQECYVNDGRIIKNGKGTIKINRLVDETGSDFKKLYQIAEEFSKDGAKVELTPKISRPKKFNYDCIYGSLKGTEFYGKCPDLRVDNIWYEHEGITTGTGKRAFSNMMKRGLEQSDRLIIDECGLTDAFMKRSIFNRNANGADIKEVWIRSENGVRLLFKKFEEPQK